MEIKEYEEKMGYLAFLIQDACEKLSTEEGFWEAIEDIMRRRQELIFSQIPF